MEREQINFKDFQLYVGLDVHKRQWSVSIYTTFAHHRTFSQPPYPKVLKSYLDKHFSGASVGYECMVVNAADIPTSNKETSEKADPSDSRK